MSSDSKVNTRRECRILILGTDHGSTSTLLEPLLWEKWDVRVTHQLSEAIDIAHYWLPQVILLDTEPRGVGQLWCTKLRQIFPHTSLVFISDESATEDIILGLEQGADDYIIKPFVPLEMLARIKTHLRVRDLHMQLVAANEKLKQLVDTDDLSGLYNMRSLYERLDREIERSQRFNRSVCVVMLDMDYFKSVNDGHDHLFGSFVISEVGKIIKSNTRNIDIPARYGGDEFLIVLTEITDEGALLFCERLRRAIEKTHFSNGQDSIRLTISLGYSSTDGKTKISSKELVQQADHALYEAKRLGRNRVCRYHKESKLQSLPKKQHKKAS